MQQVGVSVQVPNLSLGQEQCWIVQEIWRGIGVKNLGLWGSPSHTMIEMRQGKRLSN